MIGLVVYILGIIVCMYPITVFVMDIHTGDTLDSFDRGISIFLGVLLSLFWPVFLAAFLMFKLSKRVWKKFLGEEERERVNR